jgi:hypothetical protein
MLGLNSDFMVNMKELTTIEIKLENQQKIIQEFAKIWKQKEHCEKRSLTCIWRLEF